MIALGNNKHKIDTMKINGHAVLSIYFRGQRIWPEKIIDNKDDDENIIISCYYSGYWIDEYPWTDDTPWKD